MKSLKNKKRDRYFLFNTLNNQLLVSGSNFLSTILATRILGLEKFGIFSISLAIVLLTNNLLNATFLTPLLNISPKLSRVERGNYINNSFFLLCIFSIINAFIFFIIFYLFGENLGLINLNNKFPFLICFLIVFTLFYEFSRRVFFALRQIGDVYKIDIFK